jgi:AcrR family transcriptional regulator
VDTARELYGDRGLEAPLDEIARGAGVGNATVYRHFPSRCALIAAAFADTLRRVITAAERALDDPDPWEGFAGHVRLLCQMQAEDRALADLLTTQVDGAPELDGLREEAHATFVRLAHRAQEAGVLRDDFVPEDLAVLLMANAGLVHRMADAAPDAWRRFVDMTLDGLRSTAATTASSATPSEAITSAMRQRGKELHV